jgi:IrrE N-terminal-like domain
MKKDYIVSGRSNDEIRKLAMWFRRKCGMENATFFDVVACVTLGWVETVVGRKALILEILPDCEMGNDDAVTYVEPSRVTIRGKRSVWNALTKKAEFSIGNAAYFRARWTFAHELGHAVLNHDKAPMARGTGVDALTKSQIAIEPYRSAEHQANQFALAFLVDIGVAKELGSAEEISGSFAISLTAAKALFDEFLRGKKSEVISAGFSELMRGLGRPTNSSFEGIRCPTCGEMTTTAANGNKSHCGSCQRVSNNLEEGDEFYWD